MRSFKISISIDESILKRLDFIVKSNCFPNRSGLVREAIIEKLAMIEKQNHFLKECSKLDPCSEQAMAEEGFAAELNEWPEY
jgi:metal-responsive CopG/Arc/MetJ family transcriptional regulator